MVFLAFHIVPLLWAVWQTIHLKFCTAGMADEELPYAYQLDKIMAQVNWFKGDNLSPKTFLSPLFLQYFPVAMEPGMLMGVKLNDITGLFVWSPVLLMTYVDNNTLLAMSQQHIWEAESMDSCYPRHSLVVVKLFPSSPVYAMSIVYVPIMHCPF